MGVELIDMGFENFEQFHEHCQVNGHRIFVRDQIDGKWGAYSLTELGTEKTLEWAKRWWNENRMPIMMLEEMLPNGEDE